jgi:hypothetical protein
VRVWDAATGDPVAVFDLPAGIGAFSVDWSPNGRELAAGATNGDIYFFDAGPSFPPSRISREIRRPLDLLTLKIARRGRVEIPRKFFVP